MRAVVISGPGTASVEDVEPPEPAPGQVVVDVERVGVCGTDVELFRGEMAYVGQGRAWYPLRPGHEWCGRVASVGKGVDRAWIGARVVGDTMLACGTCDRCAAGYRHLCRNLVEVGISLGFPGALAEQVAVPADSLHRLPDTIADDAAALVEPGGNAWRAASAAEPREGTRVLVWGAGTIGLLTVAFARAAGAQVHLVSRDRRRIQLGLVLGAISAWSPADIGQEIGRTRFDAVIDATDDSSVPSAALDLVEPGGRVVYIGLSGEPSTIDTRRLVLKDVTAVGILSGSAGLAPAIRHYADGSVDPRPLVAATLPLERVPDVLAGWRPEPDRGRPKIVFDPRL
jgi:2-desacetyl-2-hydroxyethyl bacteriochlorophyllide A dehydrogenase